MKLSEAIRLGAMIFPETRSLFINSKTRECCALGAAAQAAGDDQWNQDRVIARWPILIIEASCPMCATNPLMLRTRISHLHADHKQSREWIADFVETIERAQEPVIDSARVREEVSVG